MIRKFPLSNISTAAHYNSYISSLQTKNILNQNFNPNTINSVWTCDFTYLKIKNKNIYLCAIMDLYSRKIVGWKLSYSLDTKLLMKTFKYAFLKRGKPSNLIFHSDMGCQFTSLSFNKLLDKLNVCHSYSRKGYPYDNACMECFFKFLKKEETNRTTYDDASALHKALHEYIDIFYNKNRPHSSLNYQSPCEKEAYGNASNSISYLMPVTGVEPVRALLPTGF